MKKICCHNFLCSHKFHKIATYYSFEVLKKKNWANFQRIIELFTQKIVAELKKRVWDPGSEKNLFRIQGPKRHRIPDPEHYKKVEQCGNINSICAPTSNLLPHPPGLHGYPMKRKSLKKFTKRQGNGATKPGHGP
jgi:hypothetical protein